MLDTVESIRCAEIGEWEEMRRWPWPGGETVRVSTRAARIEVKRYSEGAAVVLLYRQVAPRLYCVRDYRVVVEARYLALSGDRLADLCRRWL